MVLPYGSIVSEVKEAFGYYFGVTDGNGRVLLVYTFPIHTTEPIDLDNKFFNNF